MEVGTAWADDSATDKKAKAEKLIEGITKAADAPHDIFAGLRIFSSSLRKAADSDDAAKLDKALNMKANFLKALPRLVKKIEAEQVKMKAQAEAMQKAQAEAAAKQAAAPPAGESATDDDDDDDPDLDSAAPAAGGAGADADGDDDDPDLDSAAPA